MNKLSLAALRSANIERLPLFKNKKGELAHSRPDGSDWSPSQWLQAVVGELGEYANIRKKYERGDIDAEEFALLGGKELADVQTYLDLLAMRCLDDPRSGFVHPTGIDLGAATVAKFNEVSERVGCAVTLDEAPDVEAVREEFNAAIDFAIKFEGDSEFLRAWREGDHMIEWPEFEMYKETRK